MQKKKRRGKPLLLDRSEDKGQPQLWSSKEF
jgi:hypothetical protein